MLSRDDSICLIVSVKLLSAVRDFLLFVSWKMKEQDVLDHMKIQLTEDQTKLNYLNKKAALTIA